MSRLIDAENLLKIIDDCDLTWDGGVDINELNEIINKQPTVNQWIPCSVMLPEVEKWVLVSSGDCVISDSVVVRDGKPIWYICGTIDIEQDAWMPLPEPYKEET